MCIELCHSSMREMTSPLASKSGPSNAGAASQECCTLLGGLIASPSAAHRRVKLLMSQAYSWQASMEKGTARWSALTCAHLHLQ